jgi:ABC-type transport system involved in multi-copper enzyme maturation permease subunit
MINLLKADLFRVLRTKIVYISLIIAIVLPLFICLVNGLTELAVRSLDPEMTYPYGVGDSTLVSTFSPLMSFSYIFAVFPVIVIMMDFGNGTLRNKIIFGYTRHQIYAAHFIVTLTHVGAITLLFTLTNVVSSLAFGISPVPASLIPTFLIYYFVGFLGIVLTASLGSCLALALGNAGAIVLTIFGVIILNNAGSFIGLILKLSEVSGGDNFLCFFPSYFIDSLSNYMLYKVEVEIDSLHLVGSIIGVLALAGAFYALGTFVFNRRDFK